MQPKSLQSLRKVSCDAASSSSGAESPPGSATANAIHQASLKVASWNGNLTPDLIVHQSQRHIPLTAVHNIAPALRNHIIVLAACACKHFLQPFVSGNTKCQAVSYIRSISLSRHKVALTMSHAGDNFATDFSRTALRCTCTSSMRWCLFSHASFPHAC